MHLPTPTRRHPAKPWGGPCREEAAPRRPGRKLTAGEGGAQALLWGWGSRPGSALAQGGEGEDPPQVPAQPRLDAEEADVEIAGSVSGGGRGSKRDPPSRAPSPPARVEGAPAHHPHLWGRRGPRPPGTGGPGLRAWGSPASGFGGPGTGDPPGWAPPPHLNEAVPPLQEQRPPGLPWGRQSGGGVGRCQDPPDPPPPAPPHRPHSPLQVAASGGPPLSCPEQRNRSVTTSPSATSA